MTIDEMKAKAAEMKAEVARLDKLADDGTISNEEFDRLTRKANEVHAEYAMLQKKIDFLSVKTLTRVSSWSASFLDSFDCGTRNVTNKQAEIFKRFNNGKPFIWNGRRYDCPGANYRAGFSALIVTLLT